MKYAKLTRLAAAGVAFCVTGCATAPGQSNGVQRAFNDTFNNADPCANNARNTGMLVGAAAGALLGMKAGHKDKGAILAGALLGTALGGAIGADIDTRRCNLAKVAREYQLQMTFAAVGSDGVTVSDAELNHASNAEQIKKNAIGNIVSLQDAGAEGGHFESNSDVLTPRAERYFSAIADIYNQEKYARTMSDPTARERTLRAGAERKLLLVGHTDDTGSSRLNADLSERRARAVAEYLERRGIPRDQIYYQGAGEVYPVADNNTEAGRAQNRRVEIVELNNAANFDRYLEARRPNYHFYRSEAAPDAAATLADATVPPRAAPAVPAARKPPQRKAGSPAGTSVKPNAGSEGTRAIAAASAAAKPAASAAAAASAAPVTPARPAAHAAGAPALMTTGTLLDFGGTPLTDRTSVVASVGRIEKKRPLFSLISDAYADDMPALTDCSQDHPRVSGAVRALKDGATYKVAEHVPGLYGKTWTERVNGHQVVVNKVAVLASEATLAQIPELKVYANYDPATNRNPKPEVAMHPEVNTYLGERGILYRMFTKGAAGMQCVDIIYSRNGGSSAKDGNIVYVHDNRLYVTAFKPVIAN
jgi:outer membrane protein OmpA-like peptidoglycan-associated protein